MSDAVESLAKQHIFNFERKNGRKPKDKSGKGYDIVSGNRLIEIKARKKDYKTSAFFFISEAQHKCLKNEKNYYIYIVYNLGSKSPKMKIISKSDKFVVKPERHYRIKFNKANWNKIKPLNL